MTDKKKYITEYLNNHGYALDVNVNIADNHLSELYNLYKYGKLLPKINSDLYGFYGIYYEINNHLDTAIQFYKFLIQNNPNDTRSLHNLIGIYKKDNNLNEIYNLFDVLVSDKQKYEYLTLVYDIPGFNLTNQMIYRLTTMDLDDSAPLSLKLMKSVFNKISI